MRRGDALETLIWELRRTFRELADAADRELRTLGIGSADRAFVEFLAKEDEPVTLSDLARKYSVSRQHMQQTFTRLTHPEWVLKSADPADRRIINLQLSEKGKVAWQQIRAVDQAFLRRLASKLPAGNMTLAIELLRLLRTELKEMKEEDDASS